MFAAASIISQFFPAPAAFRESHTLAQNLLQRRAALADLEVAFGRNTTARIRHLEAAVVRETWEQLAR